METWQADFYRRPLQDEAGNPLWELVICNAARSFTRQSFCSQSAASADWVSQQLQFFLKDAPKTPDRLQVFRPQSLNLLQTACERLGIQVEATRHTPALKQLLQEQATLYSSLPNYTGQLYQPIELDKPPPLPLPENLWGDRWQFAALAAMDLVPAFQSRSIPVREMPVDWFPAELKIPSTAPIPGVVIEAGRRSMPLVRWLQQVQPYGLRYIPGEPDGLILEAGLIDRWVLTTFTDPEVAAAAQIFRDRQHGAQGLHFLLVQPDDSGMTYTGFWLLRLME